MCLGAEQHPIDRLGLRRISQDGEWQFDRSFRPFERKPRDWLARARQNVVAAGGGEAAGRAAANAAQPNHRNAQSALLRPRCPRHGVIDRGNQRKSNVARSAARGSSGPRGPGLTAWRRLYLTHSLPATRFPSRRGGAAIRLTKSVAAARRVRSVIRLALREAWRWCQIHRRRNANQKSRCDYDFCCAHRVDSSLWPRPGPLVL